MHRLCWKTLAIALFMSSVAYGQSLGDIAVTSPYCRTAGSGVEPVTYCKSLSSRFSHVYSLKNADASPPNSDKH